MFRTNRTFLLVVVLAFVFSIVSFGKPYEGPVPENFDQAPMLEELVKQGELPPVEERIPRPEDLYVVDPWERVGDYGGTIRLATRGPTSAGDGHILVSYQGMVMPTYDGSGFRPEIAKSVETSADEETWTIRLRKGMKWSDGHPFTADDILFWYDDVLLNDQLTPVIGPTWKTEGEVMEMQKLDDYTIQIEFTSPKPYFDRYLVYKTFRLT